MMKNLKRVLALTLMLVALGSVALPGLAVMELSTAVAEFDGEITILADIIDWRYKTVDGWIYRRLYNYSRGVWIGEWEAC